MPVACRLAGHSSGAWRTLCGRQNGAQCGADTTCLGFLDAAERTCVEFRTSRQK